MIRLTDQNIISTPRDSNKEDPVIIPFILEKVTALYPQKEAIVCGEKRFTYSQFAGRIHRLADFLCESGIGKGDCVAILHHNHHEFLETYFAVAQRGAMLNPLNYRLSQRELDFILKDSQATLLIAAKRYHDVVKTLVEMNDNLNRILWTEGEGQGMDIPNSYDYEDIIAQASPAVLPADHISDEDIAHLYYTSGTTGRSKGVMLSHKNVCTHALAAIAELKLSDHDNWVHVAPLFHLADAWATFAISWVGGKHVIVPDFKPSEVLLTIQNEKITITNMVPTMLNALVHTPDVSHFNFSSLRAILSGGAPIATEVVKKIMDTFKCDYIQTYGMTETSPYLTVSILKENIARLSKDEQFVYKAKTGRAFLGVLLRVVREDGKDVQADNQEVGEIIVKGDIVTKGYWHLPEETKKTIKDGWLYTGDMAVIDAEGYVNIVDRKKDMIITGGENVYSIEVENVLYAHPAVMEAAVIGVPDTTWGEIVKAFVVLKPGTEVTEGEIIEYCKNNIARYKAPKSVDFLPELPKTGSGKIYKKGLKDITKSQILDNLIGQR